MNAALFQQDELSEHNVAKANPGSGPEKAGLQSFNSNSFMHCKQVRLKLHFQILLKNIQGCIYLYSNLELYEESRIKVADT